MRGHGIWALRIVKESREAEASHPASSSPVPIAASVPPAGTVETKKRQSQKGSGFTSKSERVRF